MELETRYSAEDIIRIIDQALVYQCACPAQIATTLLELRDLFDYQQKCADTDDTNRRVHGRATRVTASRSGEDPTLREAAESIVSEMRSGAVGASADSGRAESIALHLAAQYGEAAAASSCAGLTRPRLERVLALVEERLTEALPVSQLADAVHLSPFHFSRMFRVSTGRSPHEWIMLKRMARAKSLLACTRMPLPDVAKASGYRTHSHFSGMFHAVVGMTPGQYRARHA